MLKSVRREISKHKILYLVLFVILGLAFFVRVYRVDQVLGFYFDQGRDALVIWDFWHNGKLFLIGPTTGIAGIFRGPWYYWLIAPTYLIGGGDPVYPSMFLSILTVVAIAILWWLAKEIGGWKTGIIAALIASFSYFLVLAGKWLSNPTPMMLVSMLLILSMYMITKGKRIYWLLMAISATMAIQFGSAAEVFYIPAILVFAWWQRKNLPNRKLLIISAAVFVSGFLPQILFDIKHQGILSSAIKKFLVDDQSFKANFWDVVSQRYKLYKDVFFGKLWGTKVQYYTPTLLAGIFVLAANFKKLWRSDIFKIAMLVFISPLIGMLFFQGNFGNIYDYYFTGYYFVFVLLLSSILGSVSGFLGVVILLVFFYLFFDYNLVLIKNHMIAGVDGPTTVQFGNEKQAVEWVYEDAGGREFNVDVYVPPVIPYAYDYLFEWMGETKYGTKPVDDERELLYTLYEVDLPHPERLEAWLDRQEGIGAVEEEVGFGGITVQRRERIKDGQ